MEFLIHIKFSRLLSHLKAGEQVNSRSLPVTRYLTVPSFPSKSFETQAQSLNQMAEVDGIECPSQIWNLQIHT